MASPIYGTGLSNYMNMFAGMARGMNEAERIKRLQQQQDFSNQMSVYDRAFRQNQFNQNAEWQAYDRAFNREKFDYQKDFQEQQLDRQLAGDKWGRKIDLLKLSGMNAQKPLSPKDAKAIADEKALAYNRSATAEERNASREFLKSLGDSVYYGPLSVESNREGFLSKGANLTNAFNPLTYVHGYGDSFVENMSQASLGYSREGIIDEMTRVQSALNDLNEYEKIKGVNMEEDLKQTKKELMGQLEQLNILAAKRIRNEKYSPSKFVYDKYDEAENWYNKSPNMKKIIGAGINPEAALMSLGYSVYGKLFGGK